MTCRFEPQAATGDLEEEIACARFVPDNQLARGLRRWTWHNRFENESEEMGWSTRAYLVDKAGEIEGIPYARFERLWKADPAEKLTNYAGTWLRVAIAYVETVNRRPLCIRHVDYLRIKLDHTGRIDKAWFELTLRLAGETIALPWLGTESSRSDNLLRAEHLFAKRRYKHECSWEPTETQREAIAELALR